MGQYPCDSENSNGDTMTKLLTNMDRQVMAAYLPPDLARRIRTHAKTTRRSLSSVMAEAVAGYFDRLDRLAELEQAARKTGA